MQVNVNESATNSLTVEYVTKSPTLARSEEDHGYIRMDKISIGMRPFG